MTSSHTQTRTVGKRLLYTTCLAGGTVLLMAACSSVKPPPKPYSQDTLPQSVLVPAGHQVVLETTATGLLNYECRPTATGPYAWVLMSPQANLLDRTGKDVVAYTGPPAKWTHIDGSSVVGTQVAVSPNGEYTLPLQLARAEPSMGSGVLQNISFIQRIKTKGGVEKTKPCAALNTGEKLTLPYQADYIFWRPV
ncbi:DUF3455 domain-containing protein [Polaromonas sp. SM01]|uniref:DUF3455 domain-containing protein n=1 Tax=Polaromonas sp. SM01 TaxID=3085630 RepID=UPI0029813BB1|nr:DUF3455 domain-containing protein [Polaromonas sp. SM01]MDW5443373.1 DUF3455 domain-containing protein [Polaromonas sp. SM01]